MAKAPKRPSPRDAQAKAKKHLAPATQPTPSFNTCSSCPAPDACAFEGKCDRPRLGRPTIFTDALFEEILDRLALGETTEEICRDEDMPDRKTIWRWQKADPSLAPRLAHARVEGSHFRIERAALVANDASEDLKIEMTDSGPRVVINGFVLQRAKLIADIELRVAALLNPARYGTKIDVTSGGEKIGSVFDAVTLITQMQQSILSRLDDEAVKPE